MKQKIKLNDMLLAFLAILLIIVAVVKFNESRSLQLIIHAEYPKTFWYDTNLTNLNFVFDTSTAWPSGVTQLIWGSNVVSDCFLFTQVERVIDPPGFSRNNQGLDCPGCPDISVMNSSEWPTDCFDALPVECRTAWGEQCDDFMNTNSPSQDACESALSDQCMHKCGNLYSSECSKMLGVTHGSIYQMNYNPITCSVPIGAFVQTRGWNLSSSTLNLHVTDTSVMGYGTHIGTNLRLNRNTSMEELGVCVDFPTLPPSHSDYMNSQAKLVVQITMVNGASIYSSPNVSTPSNTSTTPIATGSLSVNSNPDAAKVYVNNSYKALTNSTITDLPVGSASVLLSKTGYNSHSVVVTILENTTVTVNANLTATPAAANTSGTTPPLNASKTGKTGEEAEEKGFLEQYWWLLILATPIIYMVGKKKKWWKKIL